MSSVRLRILQEAVVRLNDSRPPEIPEFKLMDALPTPDDDHPACVIYPGKEGVEPASNRASPLSQRTLRAICEVRVAGDNPIVTADSILVWITSKLNGVRLSTVADPRLSQEILEKDITWKIAQRNKPFMAVFVELEIPYTTKSSDQELVS